MNAGARASSGALLFFLHADTQVPAGYAAAIARAVRSGAVAGRFDVTLDGEGLLLRAIEAGINVRSRWTRLWTGDQGLFVRRDVFEAVGGYPEEMPILEDLALAAILKRAGRVACLRERLTTSARRWRRRGVLRTVLLMWGIRALYALGVPPVRLARLYRDVR